jgi:hypothetical protein
MRSKFSSGKWLVAILSILALILVLIGYVAYTQWQATMELKKSSAGLAEKLEIPVENSTSKQTITIDAKADARKELPASAFEKLQFTITKVAIANNHLYVLWQTNVTADRLPATIEVPETTSKFLKPENYVSFIHVRSPANQVQFIAYQNMADKNISLVTVLRKNCNAPITKVAGTIEVTPSAVAHFDPKQRYTYYRWLVIGTLLNTDNDDILDDMTNKHVGHIDLDLSKTGTFSYSFATTPITISPNSFWFNRMINVDKNIPPEDYTNAGPFGPPSRFIVVPKGIWDACNPTNENFQLIYN